jgi:hypothetical protein
MSKRHQASRRRTYGRRQHELHQRPDVRETELVVARDLERGATEAGGVAVPFRGRRDGSVAFGFLD